MLPSGTVTFLFTDVEGSTRLLQELGPEGYAEALAGHRRALRAAFAAHDGVEVDTQGDAFFVAFPTAPGALAAAAELTYALAPGPIRVRVGVHTGTPFVTEEGYVGVDVHRAARIAAAGHGAQVLVSASTAALADGAELRDLGEHRFKDLTAAERVFQLGGDDFPPLKTLYQTNLPVPATTFLGRVDDLEAVVERLRHTDVRLLTLTGPGGTGKTRLALQAAAEAADEFPDGITWVPLAPLRDPALVLATVAQALGIPPEGERSLQDLLAGFLSGAKRLLLLDNVEHLLPLIAADLGYLREIEGPTLLVTSRERLQLRGENVLAVPSLTRSDAIALFTARAAELGVSLAPSENLEALCDRLDDLPLALELAAARTLLFPPERLLERLERRLDFLRGGRDADPRQQTLRATIAWSHELLDDGERMLFRRLSVFAGGCDYEAAETVCGGDPERLQSLLDKSLVRRRDGETGARYWLLETIREFAAECLSDAGESDELRRLHSRYYAELAAHNALPLRQWERDALDLFAAELANLRAGLDVALRADDVTTGARYLFGLLFHWLVFGSGAEAAAAARTWLRMRRPDDLADRLAGVTAASEILRFTGDPDSAIELKREALELARTIPDADLFGWTAMRLEPALLTDLAHLLIETGSAGEARAVAEEAVTLRRELGHSSGVAHALAALVELEQAEGNFDRAYGFAREALAAYERGGVAAPETVPLRALSAEFELILGDPLRAVGTLSAALGATDEVRDPSNDAILLRVGATLARHFHDTRRALAWFSAVAGLGEQAGFLLRACSEIERDAAATAHLQETLGEDVAASAERDGRETRIEELLDDLSVALARWTESGADSSALAVD